MSCLVRVTSPVVLCPVCKLEFVNSQDLSWFYWIPAIKSIKHYNFEGCLVFFYYYFCWHKTDEGRRELLPTLEENITFNMIQNSVLFLIFFFLTILTKRYITHIHTICNMSAFWWWSAVNTAINRLDQDEMQELLLRSNMKTYKMKLLL